MILLDANLLLYAYNADATAHDAAKAWLEGALAKPEPFGLSWLTILAFIRISTNPRAFPHPLQLAEAVEIISELLAQPTVTILQPGANHWAILQKTLLEGQAGGPLATDAQLAALALEHGATLHTTDRDFTRFPGLRFVNPLAV